MSDPIPPRVSPAEMVASRLCTGCGGCATLGGGTARLDWGGDGQLKPMGGADWMTRRSDAFSRICPFSPHAMDEDAIAAARFGDAVPRDDAIGRHRAAYVGHAAEDGYRDRGSSGGMVTWVAAELLKRKLVDGVAHVRPLGPDSGGFFGYGISRDLAALYAGAQSRYYPVHMADVLDEIRARPGRYAIVGIPCFIKAVHLARAREPVLAERITHSLGLVCGHMKSRHMVESFAWQMGLRLIDIERVDHRVKHPDRPASWYTARLETGRGEVRTRDWWHLVDGDWGSGFHQNRACDFCDDVVAETADISFGDAWVEPYTSDGRGTNVVVARSAEMFAILEDARADGRLQLRSVDAAFVKDTQAAGFRQRREGLAYRLTWARSGVKPRKRVAPGKAGLPLRRRLIYRARHGMTRAGLTLFRLARRTGRPALFLVPARGMLTLYRALTYSQGRLGRAFDRIEAYFLRDAA